MENTRASILIVDDEPINLDIICAHLEDDNYELLRAENGQQAWSMLEAEPIRFDTIILDRMMPGMDGWTVLRKLKADNNLKDIPVVMISMVGDKAMSYSLGAVESLQKPVDRGRLSALVKKYALSGQKTALVVEDDPAARETMVRTLQGDGWEVDEAENGKIALEKTEREEFKLILLDLMMPVMDGLEATRRLRDREATTGQRTTIVAMTAGAMRSDQERCADAGMDDYLAKPFNPRELLARVRAVLRRTQQAQEVSDQVPSRVVFGAFALDLASHRLTRGADTVPLTSGEFDLLSILVTHPNKVLDRDRILDLLTGAERSPFDRSIDVPQNG